MPAYEATVMIRGIAVHVDALMGLCHQCEPEHCAAKPTCCGVYEVHVSPRELTAIIGVLEEARAMAPRLQEEEPFEEADDGLVLGSDDDGVCVFAYRNSKGQTLCALHALALKHDLDPAVVKPKACMLWPLALSQGPPRHLTVVDDAYAWPCNTPRPLGATGLDPGVAEIVRQLFGQPFLRELESICSQRGFTGHYESDTDVESEAASRHANGEEA